MLSTQDPEVPAQSQCLVTSTQQLKSQEVNVEAHCLPNLSAQGSILKHTEKVKAVELRVSPAVGTSCIPPKHRDLSCQKNHKPGFTFHAFHHSQPNSNEAFYSQAYFSLT